VDKKILRLLIVDDSPDDAELAATALRKGGYMLKTQRVQDLAGLQAALDKGRWDVVVSEYTMPHFGALPVFDLIKRAGLDVPLVVFTRSIADADLVKVMRAGAHDVIIKNQTIRLAPVIERELRVAEMRRSYREAMQSLDEVENKHRAIIEGSREAICYSQDGMHINANKAYLVLFGYDSAEDLEGIPVMNLIDKTDQAKFKDCIRKCGKPDTDKPQEFLAIKKNGDRFHAEVMVSSIMIEGESCTQILFSDISKRKAVENKLHYLHQHDPLTGLYNRHFFLQELNKAVEKAKDGGKTSGVIYVDLNQLKKINNAVGHAAGDRFLLKAVRLIRDKLDDSALLARFGGDEFAILLSNTNDNGLKQTATDLENTLKETPFTDNGNQFKCQCLASTALIDQRTENTHQILAAIYHASEKNKPKAVPPPAPAKPAPIVAKGPAENQRQAVPIQTGVWHNRLQAAMEQNRFELNYQPIVNLHGEPSELFEVLVRLVDENGELIAAGQFMHEAVRSGLSANIDRWVVHNAIEALGNLHREGREARFFINLCATAFKDADLLTTVKQSTREAGVKPEYLVFEIDESEVIANLSEAHVFAKGMNLLGCRLSIDNFGTNIGTLDHLRTMPVEFLKLKGTLTQNLATDNINQASLKAVLEVAKALEKKTIAKSVEAADNLASLWNCGVDYVQGNYFQQADAQLDYEFAGETELSSDSAPLWANHLNGR
jgi:multidomain signaling protein FimX